MTARKDDMVAQYLNAMRRLDGIRDRLFVVRTIIIDNATADEWEDEDLAEYHSALAYIIRNAKIIDTLLPKLGDD